jgi:hypothetical protein
MAKKKSVPEPAEPQTPLQAATELVDKFAKLSEKSSFVFREVCGLEERILGLLAVCPENKLVLGDGRVVSRKDNFASSNTKYKNTAVKRFEVVLSAAPIAAPAKSESILGFSAIGPSAADLVLTAQYPP